jgi:hypothetical protein
MCVQALMADTLGSPFAFHNSEGVKRFDDCASFRLIYCECNHTLSYCSLGGFNTLRQDFGVRFEDSGFVELHQSLWFARTPADREINNIAAAISTPFCYKS